METSERKLSTPLRLLLRFAGNIVLVWLMATYLQDEFFVTGGLAAYIIIGALLTLMNIIVRPILTVIAFPFKLFAYLLALIIVNGLFVWIINEIMFRMDPDIVTMAILGGLSGWIVVAIWFGIGNWLMKAALK